MPILGQPWAYTHTRTGAAATAWFARTSSARSVPRLKPEHEVSNQYELPRDAATAIMQWHVKYSKAFAVGAEGRRSDGMAVLELLQQRARFYLVDSGAPITRRRTKKPPISAECRREDQAAVLQPVEHSTRCHVMKIGAVATGGAKQAHIGVEARSIDPPAVLELLQNCPCFYIVDSSAPIARGRAE
eukprot:CAMPEP_0180815194 /NCGR_PEP_ID=MMETSP1038_2-20121128/67488_1 /TAXON_ID=632150 /ORGANISM="Azadinium spinosum, Strain 3D9" /LENGTH=186 /DNA_ID=CAMNT_0022856935 /DNA_START=92 /DNA_END=653 /DNA_ORIENTATION=+